MFTPLMMSLGEQFWCLEQQFKRLRAPPLSSHRALVPRGEQFWCLEEQFKPPSAQGSVDIQAGKDVSAGDHLYFMYVS